MSTEFEGRARLFALYEDKIRDAEQRSAQLRQRFAGLIDGETREGIAHQISRLDGQARDYRDKAEELRGSRLTISPDPGS